jgi:hypothetical protein
MHNKSTKIVFISSASALLLAGFYAVPAFAQRQDNRTVECRKTLAFTAVPEDRVAMTSVQQDENRDNQDTLRRNDKQKQKRPCLRLASL